MTTNAAALTSIVSSTLGSPLIKVAGVLLRRAAHHRQPSRRRSISSARRSRRGRRSK